VETVVTELEPEPEPSKVVKGGVFVRSIVVSKNYSLQLKIMRLFPLLKPMRKNFFFKIFFAIFFKFHLISRL
jgi:hypothetical protein